MRDCSLKKIRNENWKRSNLEICRRSKKDTNWKQLGIEIENYQRLKLEEEQKKCENLKNGQRVHSIGAIAALAKAVADGFVVAQVIVRFRIYIFINTKEVTNAEEVILGGAFSDDQFKSWIWSTRLLARVVGNVAADWTVL